MFSGQDVLEQALRLLNYTDTYGRLDGQQHGEMYKRGLAAVNQIYADLGFMDDAQPFIPLGNLKEPLLLTDKQIQDVMPYGVAMLLAMSEGDGDNQQLYAAIYNRKRAASPVTKMRKDVLFRRNGKRGTV